jgi:hypothetical protein
MRFSCKESLPDCLCGSRYKKFGSYIFIAINKERGLKGHEISAILRKTKRLELKECAILLANDLGIQPKAAFVSLGFAVPEMQEVRILSAWMALLCP